MHQAPAWLPYRLRNWIDQLRIDRAVGGIGRTRSQSAAEGGEGGQAAAEVHMLLCRRDLRIGLVALKSLLRFAGGRLAVALSHDGSLTERDRAWVSRHIPGARWLVSDADAPAMRRALEGRPRLAELYRRGFVFAHKLLNPIVLGAAERMVQLDSDTAFFRRPDRLLAWMESADVELWYLHDHQDEATAVPAAAAEALDRLARDLAPPGRRWQVAHRFFNAGLLLYHRWALDLDLAEAYLDWQSRLPETDRLGKMGIWFGDWTLEQTAYHVIFALSSAPVHPLGDDYHLGGAEGHVFNHFLRHYLVQKPTLARLRALVDDLD